MKSIRMHGMIAGTSALLLAALSAQATIIDTGTLGNWWGKYGSGALGGRSAYLLNAYTSGGYTPNYSGQGDLTSPSLSSFVTAISYTTMSTDTVPAPNGFPSGYGNGSGYTAANYLQDPRNLDGVRSYGRVYDGTAWGFNIQLTLAADCPNEIQLALYSYSPYPSDTTLSRYWGPAGTHAEMIGGTFPTVSDAVTLTTAEVTDGAWAVFDITRNGQTQLNILMQGSLPIINAIMFDEIIPEPNALALMGIGAGLLWLRRWNQRQTA